LRKGVVGGERGLVEGATHDEDEQPGVYPIELPVAIAVIALLISILPPREDQARRAGYTVVADLTEFDLAVSVSMLDDGDGVDGDDVILFFTSWDASGVGYPGC